MKEYIEFMELLQHEKKQEAVEFALSLLKNGEMDVVTLYAQVLTPALNEMQCLLEDKRMCIWKEHVRTAIVRTIVECCYPYVIMERDKRGAPKHKTAVIICPPEEYHDLGARMVADFFVICGYDAIFVGSNTPYGDFYNAAHIISPDIIAISISDYYNLVVTKMIIGDLKGILADSVKIIVGGSAVYDNDENYKMLGADFRAQTFEDIQKITADEVGV